MCYVAAFLFPNICRFLCRQSRIWMMTRWMWGNLKYLLDEMNFVCHKCNTCPVGVTFYTFIFLLVVFFVLVFYCIKGAVPLPSNEWGDQIWLDDNSCKLLSNQKPWHISLVNLDFLCFINVFKDALDHRLLHPQLFAKCVGFSCFFCFIFGVNRGIFSIFCFLCALFFFLMICPWIFFYCVDEKWGRNKRRQKKTNSRQLRMSDYCKMTNKEAMGLFLQSCSDYFNQFVIESSNLILKTA